MTIEDQIEKLLASPDIWLDCSSYFELRAIQDTLEILGVKYDVFVGTSVDGSLYGKHTSLDTLATWNYSIKILED